MIECPTCKMKIKDREVKRCPRCYSILKTMKQCGDCKGCSVFSVLNKNHTDRNCPNH